MQQSNSSSPHNAGSPPEVHGKHHHHVLPKLKGRVELIIGPMFAGKSTELLRRMKRHEVAGSKCLKIKFSEDPRYSVDSIATHDR